MSVWLWNAAVRFFALAVLMGVASVRGSSQTAVPTPLTAPQHDDFGAGCCF
jgi:hypothetical protein